MAGKVLFLRGGAIGDFILTLPAIRLVRQQLPAAEVEVLGYRPILRLATSPGHAHRARSIEHAPLARFFAPQATLDPAYCSYFASFSVVISYLHDPNEWFHDNLQRAGVPTILRGPHKPVAPGSSAAKQLAKPLESLALFLEDDQAYPLLEPGETEQAEAARFLDQAVQTPLIALHPGSGGLAKNWPRARWLEVAKALAKQHPESRFLIVSGEAEDERIGHFLGQIREASLPHLHAAHLPLLTLAAVLARCRLFLGHDSGISHLAAAAGARCLLLFGPTDPSVWAPQNPQVEVLRATSGCLEDLSVPQVFAAATRSFTRMIS